MTKHQKLELTWIGKEQRPRLEPRILLEDSARSYHAKQRLPMTQKQADAPPAQDDFFAGDKT